MDGIQAGPAGQEDDLLDQFRSASFTFESDGDEEAKPTPNDNAAGAEAEAGEEGFFQKLPFTFVNVKSPWRGLLKTSAFNHNALS